METFKEKRFEIFFVARSGNLTRALELINKEGVDVNTKNRVSLSLLWIL
jgi:hypothetical protein